MLRFKKWLSLRESLRSLSHGKINFVECGREFMKSTNVRSKMGKSTNRDSTRRLKVIVWNPLGCLLWFLCPGVSFPSLPPQQPIFVEVPLNSLVIWRLRMASDSQLSVKAIRRGEKHSNKVIKIYKFCCWIWVSWIKIMI